MGNTCVKKKAICLFVIHRMFNMLNPKMEVWKMIVLSIGCFLGSSRSFSGVKDRMCIPQHG